MKKALKINLSGQIFHIDEDAYDKLRIYLDTISSHFSNVEESKEIIADIEARIAEHFTAKVENNGKVITIQDVEEIIEIMGKPEEIADEEESHSKESFSESRSSRKLYRDPDHAVLGGVAAGLGAYFGIDVLGIRILFVVLILVGWGFPFILYLILWIAVPNAITAAEKLEMKGEKVNVSNIEKKIREEYESAKKNIKNARNSDAARRTENFFQEFFRVLGVIILAFFKVIVAIIAIAFVVAGISIVVSVIGAAFFGAGFAPLGFFHGPHIELREFMVPFLNPVNVGVIAISSTLLVIIPILAILYGLFKALFKFKARDRGLGLSALALWVLALITTISMVFVEARGFSDGEDAVTTSVIKDINGDTLYVSMDEGKLAKLEWEDRLEIDNNWYLFEDEDAIFGSIELDIEKGYNDDFEIGIEKSSRGYDEEDALERIKKIGYSYSIEGNRIELDPYFEIDKDDKWRFQNIDITIYVPEGKAVNLNSNTSDYLSGIYNLDHISTWKMGGKTWVMQEDGLSFSGK